MNKATKLQKLTEASTLNFVPKKQYTSKVSTMYCDDSILCNIPYLNMVYIQHAAQAEQYISTILRNYLNVS